MRRLLVIMCLTLAPAVAFGETAVTGVEVESTEPEVRVVVELDNNESTPAHRLMSGSSCLRLRFVDVVTEGVDERVEDETLRRVRVIYYHNRTVVRVDPRSASSVDLFERAEVQPHPRGLVIVIRRTDREQDRYRAAHQPEEPEERAVESASAEEDEEEEAAPSASSPSEVSASSDEESDDEGAPEAASAASTSPISSAARSRSSRDDEGENEGNGSGNSIRAATLMGFVVFLGGMAWYVKRRRGKGGAGRPAPSIDVVSAKRIGPRQSLLLVEVGGKTLLVGATEKGMNRLATIEAESMAGLEEEESLEDDFELDGEEEYAPVTAKKKPDRSELERELKRSVGLKEETAPSIGFDRAYRGATSAQKTSTPGLTDLLVAARNSKREIKDIRSDSASVSGGISPDAVEGLLRLRQMADDSPAIPSSINGTNGHSKGKSNGDMSLAALESLLISRQAN